MIHYLLLLGTLLLVSCSGDFETRTPRPGNKNGTDRPYLITNSFMKNEQFKPQAHLEYQTVGLASWYGPGFHNKKTSIGETYNQHAFTAAHRTLPLPCIAKITNLENGKTIVVKVNDRGPFTGDHRIVDVTLAGAKALGFHNKGTAKVKVETLIAESIAYNQKKVFVGEALHLAKEFSSTPAASKPICLVKAPVPTKPTKLANTSKPTANPALQKAKRAKT